MKKVDILFLYETKVRELENICLIKNELENRGYTVGVQNTWNSLGIKRFPYKAKVVVTHGMYHDGIYEFVESLVGDVPKVVNMQCEQVGTIKDESCSNSRFILQGIAKQCMNICWGRKTFKRLIEKSGIDENHLRETGHVTLDFCRKEFRSYYLSREDVCRKYNINGNLKLNLFISSFAYVNLPDQIKKNSDMIDKEKFIEISKQSFDEVLGWFSKILKEFPQEVIIYRPHPAEADNKKLLALTKEYENRFFVISDMSVKQWIAIADSVYTWYSTSMAEALMFGVPCGILRPVKSPQQMEIAVFENASFIETYEDFKVTIQEGVINNAVDKEVFSAYYTVDDEMSYMKVANAIVDVLKNDDYLIRFKRSKKKQSLKDRCKEVAHAFLCFVKTCLPKKWKILDKYKKPIVDEYTKQLQKKNYASSQEILQIQNRLKAYTKK